MQSFKGYVSSYNVQILNYFFPELQLKDNESSIRNKIIGLLTQLKRFKSVKILFLEFNKIENDDKNYIALSIRIEAQKQLLIKATLMMYLNQYIILLYQTYKSLYVKIQVGLLILS